MRASESARRRVLGLLVLAVVALLGRSIAVGLGASEFVGRVLYIFALASLTVCVLVIARDRM